MMYQAFAYMYDALNGATFYEKWYAFLQPYLVDAKTVLDLGCGSGTLLAKIQSEQLAVTGVDLSEDMLALARSKLQAGIGHFELYENDMTEFVAAKESYDIIISSCDSINYLSSAKLLEKLFTQVWEMLTPNGYCIFDVHSDMTFLERFPNWLYADSSEEVSVIWETFSADDFCFEHELTFFQKQQNGLYQRYEETHREYFYQTKQLMSLFGELGFEIESLTSDFEKSYNEHGERSFFVLRKVPR